MPLKEWLTKHSGEDLPRDEALWHVQFATEESYDNLKRLEKPIRPMTDLSAVGSTTILKSAQPFLHACHGESRKDIIDEGIHRSFCV